jgi:hypothetical protein
VEVGVGEVLVAASSPAEDYWLIPLRTRAGATIPKTTQYGKKVTGTDFSQNVCVFFLHFFVHQIYSVLVRINMRL